MFPSSENVRPRELYIMATEKFVGNFEIQVVPLLLFSLRKALVTLQLDLDCPRGNVAGLMYTLYCTNFHILVMFTISASNGATKSNNALPEFFSGKQQ